MAPEATSAVSKASQTPYQLDIPQTTTACKVLLQHIAKETKRIKSKSEKQDLLANDDGSEEDETTESNDMAIWLILTTKKHIVDQKRLKPNKIVLPHPINGEGAASTICLITADPQEKYTALVQQPSFPSTLRPRITRVISISNLKKNHKSFESLRKLSSEHDIFLADDRIITYLPKILGKTFYKSGSKRPIPVNIAAGRERGEDGKRAKIDPASGRKIDKDKIQGGRGPGSPEQAAREIDRALKSALVHLAPGTSTAVRVARAGGFTPDMVSENVQAVVADMVERMVSNGWRNIRAVHVKGPNTMAFPIWLASELWVDDEDVLEEKKGYGNKGKKALKKQKRVEGAEEAPAAEQPEKKAKRKAEDTAKPEAAKHAKKKRKGELDEKLAAEKTLRQAKLKQQKAAIMAEVP